MNFPNSINSLAVMQFGGQHPGGMGVPAVGMAFPGYVAQPQLGMGNSEMTWYSKISSHLIVYSSLFSLSSFFFWEGDILLS